MGVGRRTRDCAVIRRKFIQRAAMLAATLLSGAATAQTGLAAKYPKVAAEIRSFPVPAK